MYALVIARVDTLPFFERMSNLSNKVKSIDVMEDFFQVAMQSLAGVVQPSESW